MGRAIVNKDRFIKAMHARGYSLLRLGNYAEEMEIMTHRSLQRCLSNGEINKSKYYDICRIIDISPDWISGNIGTDEDDPLLYPFRLGTLPNPDRHHVKGAHGIYIGDIELIYCKECLWYIIDHLKSDGTADKRYRPSWCELHRVETRDDFFCAWGNRAKND